MSLHLPRPASSSRPAVAAEDVQMSSSSIEPNHTPSTAASIPTSPTLSSSHWFSRLPSVQQQQTLSGPISASSSSQLAREAARELRQERATAAGRSPFVPKRVQQGRGHMQVNGHSGNVSSGKDKGRALTEEEEEQAARQALAQMDLSELELRLERNNDLLKSPATLAHLPGGDAKIRQQHARLLNRIQELREVGGIGEGLSRTTIASAGTPTTDGADMEQDIKREDTDDADRSVNAKHGSADANSRAVEDDPSTSPLIKRRLAARTSAATMSSSTTGALSLAESMELQRAHVARERVQAQLRAEKEAALARMSARALRSRSKTAGKRVKDEDDKPSTVVDDFMLHADSDSDGRIHSDDDSDDDLLDVDAVLHAASAGAAQSVLGAGRHAGTVGFDGRSTRQTDRHMNEDDGHGVEHDMENDDEEEAQLNPLRAAYESGWRRAEREEQALASMKNKMG